MVKQKGQVEPCLSIHYRNEARPSRPAPLSQVGGATVSRSSAATWSAYSLVPWRNCLLEILTTPS